MDGRDEPPIGGVQVHSAAEPSVATILHDWASMRNLALLLLMLYRAGCAPTVADPAGGAEGETSASLSAGGTFGSAGGTFGYYSSGDSLAEHQNHVNIKHIGGGPGEGVSVAAQLAALRGSGKKALISIAPMLFSSEGVQFSPTWVADWGAFADAIINAGQADMIRAISIADEPDVTAAIAGVSQDVVKQNLETVAVLVKAKFPNAKTFVVYATHFKEPGVRLAQNIDWNSFDCYGPFESCFGSGYSIPQLVSIFKSKLAPTQEILLFPDATLFFYDFTGRRAVEGELHYRAKEYAGLALSDPRIVGMIPFLWKWADYDKLADPVKYIASTPGLRRIWDRIGRYIVSGDLSTPGRSGTVTVPAVCASAQPDCAVQVQWSTSGVSDAAVWRRPYGATGPEVVMCAGVSGSCSSPVPYGRYLLELRASRTDPQADLLETTVVEVRSSTGMTSGQITHAPSACAQGDTNQCRLYLSANVQNNRGAGIWIRTPLLSAPVNMCGANIVCHVAVGAVLASSFQVQFELRESATDPSSRLLDSRAVVFNPPPPPPPAQRLGYIDTNNVFWVKEGALSNTWVRLHSDVSRAAIAGDRIGILTTGGQYFVKEGALDAAWVQEQTGVAQIALSGTRIGYVDTAGNAFVKEGHLWANWIASGTGVTQLLMSPSRVGVLDSTGSLFVKEGALANSFVRVYSGAARAAVTDTRVGVVDAAGTYFVKEGEIWNNWVSVVTGATHIALTDNRVGYVGSGSSGYVKEGQLWTSWVHEYTPVSVIDLSADRIGVLTATGQFLVKQGGLDASWAPLAVGATQMVLPR